MTTDLELLSKKARRQAAMAEAGLLPHPGQEELLQRIEYVFITPAPEEAALLNACRAASANMLASLCIPSPWIGKASQFLLESKTALSSVVAFPFGFPPVEAKKIEAFAAAAAGAQEIQVSLSPHTLKIHDRNGLRREMEELRSALVKSELTFIIETSLLSDEEIITIVRAAELARAERVKGGSGFWGATSLHGAAILRCAAPDWMGVTAVLEAGNAKNALPLLAAGADRIATSAPQDLPGFVDISRQEETPQNI
jgi:deoxyribose-phosphate aldolase